jgi:hypothetical protein
MPRDKRELQLRALRAQLERTAKKQPSSKSLGSSKALLGNGAGSQSGTDTLTSPSASSPDLTARPPGGIGEEQDGSDGAAAPEAAEANAASTTNPPELPTAKAVVRRNSALVIHRPAIKQKPSTEASGVDQRERHEVAQRERVARLNGIDLNRCRGPDGQPLNFLEVLASRRTSSPTPARRAPIGGVDDGESLYTSPSMAGKVARFTASPTGRCARAIRKPALRTAFCLLAAKPAPAPERMRAKRNPAASAG